jgi:hypothetical protein
LYADEDYDNGVVIALRLLGHDVLRVQEAQTRGQPDYWQLAFATHLGRAIVTFNHGDFQQLHWRDPGHAGIISCTRDPDRIALAMRIHLAITPPKPLDQQFIRITRPSQPPPQRTQKP